MNRDDAGLAKRLPYGGSLRTRISSQCLKYHWRKTGDVHAIGSIAGAAQSFRSRSLVDSPIVDKARALFSTEVVDALAQGLTSQSTAERGDEKPMKRGYVVVGLPGLIGNLGGDRALAGAVLHNLLHLIAEVSLGAKLGSTAPYSRAAFPW